MSFLDKYVIGMDYIRKEFNLHPDTNMYECVHMIVDNYKKLVEENTKLKQQISQEKKDDKPKSSKSGRTK